MGIPMARSGGLTRNLRFQRQIPRGPPETVGFFIRPWTFYKVGTIMQLDYTKLDGLVAAVIQDHQTGRVLMVGFMNEEAFKMTVETGYATFYSRSRNKLWLKGETSGHRLVVKDISTDCDRDAVLLKVEAIGPGVCHEGYQSCFFRRLDQGHWVESEPRAYDPKAVYGN